MEIGSVSDVHQALAYTDADASALKQIRLVWQKLEKLKTAAGKGERTALRAYSEFLSKNIELARKHQEVADPEQASAEFWNWYLGRCHELGVEALEFARGKTHQAWCEKWLQQAWKPFATAIEKMTESPSQVNFDTAKVTAEKMLRAYVEAFKDH